jgi:hypothetical protein
LVCAAAGEISAKDNGTTNFICTGKPPGKPS